MTSLRALMLAATMIATATASLAAEMVKVHSEWPEAQRKALAATVEKSIPGLTLEWVTPDKAEMLWGVPVRILMGLARSDVLEPYTPAGAEQLRPSFRSADLPMRWQGLTARAPAICYNTTIGNETFAMPDPSTWESLTGADFHLAYGIGPQLQLTDLSVSPVGTGLLNGWMAAMGPTAATRFVKALVPNVVAVQMDAAETCRNVARGYSAVGIGITADALKMAREGAPLEIVVPTPVAYDMDGAALRKGASAAARKLADFAVSPAAMAVYAETTLIVSRPETPGTIDKLPPASSKDLESIDFTGLSELDAAVLDAWQAAKHK